MDVAVITRLAVDVPSNFRPEVRDAAFEGAEDIVERATRLSKRSRLVPHDPNHAVRMLIE